VAPLSVLADQEHPGFPYRGRNTGSETGDRIGVESRVPTAEVRDGTGRRKDACGNVSARRMMALLAGDFGRLN
jgi:hypothetical protein